MNIKKYIKTQCGLDKYYYLKQKSKGNILFKIRLYIFFIIASIRDTFK